MDGALMPVEHTVTVKPSGITFAVGTGETVFVAAARAGFSWPTICGGNGNCGTCCSQIVDGLEGCSTIGEHEFETLSTVLRAPTDGSRRLVCQLQVTADVSVQRRGVRRASAEPAAQELL
jgi:ferredoxin, 2Fe-2S